MRREEVAKGEVAPVSCRLHHNLPDERRFTIYDPKVENLSHKIIQDQPRSTDPPVTAAFITKTIPQG